VGAIPRVLCGREVSKTMTELVRKLGFTHSTIIIHLKRLEAESLIRR
jgi:DNA-binding MarR family transcriptional regulator